MTESYESLRDSVSGEAGEAWKAADREESNLRTLYRTLKEDPRYTAEHKAEQAWARYEAAKEKIAAGKAKARELLEKRVRTGERFSVPFPNDESLVTSDTSKLLVSQNEAQRLVRKVSRLDRMAERATNRGGNSPTPPSPVDMLKAEFARGLDLGGVQGGAICRGVLMAADELGVDTDEIVDGFRNERHRKNLEEAQHAERLTFLIGGKVPEPPFPRPGSRGPRGSDERRRSPALLIPRSAPVAKPGPKRAKHWS